MDFLKREAAGTNTVVTGVQNFSLRDILECGQCFRWERLQEDTYEGIVGGRRRSVCMQGSSLVFYGVAPEEFDAVWLPYFDLERDYGALKQHLCTDNEMRLAVEYTPGMRVLRQDAWEALCSFIISQNNNIGRIRGIVKNVCALFGQPLPEGGSAFPTPQRLAALSLADLQPLRLGYRAQYLLDAAVMVAEGSLLLQPLYTMPLEEARAQLRRIRGVGPKVAECALLYGFGRVECMPEDVWIKRALQGLYPQGFPQEFLPVAGLAQQYLFHYMRTGR